MKQIVGDTRNAMKIAMRNDVKIAMGTDMFLDEWGQNSKELEFYVNDGMSTIEAIECGTANGPETLGKDKNIKSGQIKKGYDADLISLNKNPLKNIKILQNENNIKIVWKKGIILKNDTDRKTGRKTESLQYGPR
eukprot:98528_1